MARVRPGDGRSGSWKEHPRAVRPPARHLLALGVALGFAWPPALFAVGEACVPHEPPDYRMSDFRAPVPCTLAGAEVVDTEALRLLIERESPLLIDVLPSPRRPEGLSEDAPWLPPARRNIPRTVWLPNTGFGELPVEEARYLRANLQRLTGGNRTRRVVFYCLADCWMSWNAARRALEWGYVSVYWYPHGTEGWTAAGLALEESSPVPERPRTVAGRGARPCRREGRATGAAPACPRGCCPAGSASRAARIAPCCRGDPRRPGPPEHRSPRRAPRR